MSEIKLVAIDIDATLLNSNRQLTTKVSQAIKNVSAQGTKVVLTSGRPLSGIKPFLAQLGLDNQNDQYVISFGGSIVETTSGQVLASNQLSFNDYLKLYQIATSLGIHFHVESADKLYTSNRDLGKYTIVEGFLTQIPVCVRTPEELSNIPLVKAMFVDDPAKIDNLVQKNELFEPLAAKLTFTRSDPAYYEANPKGVDKAYGLKILLDKLNMTPANLMAIGDQGNDLSMLKLAQVGVAMGNAIPELKAVASFVTADCDHDGVAVALEKFVAAKN